MNRDEFTARPTAALSWRAGLLGGWDLQGGREGGTWLALDTRGRLGLLTNIYTGAALLMCTINHIRSFSKSSRDHNFAGGVLDKQARGRGFLVVDWLNGNKSALEYLQDLKYVVLSLVVHKVSMIY